MTCYGLNPCIVVDVVKTFIDYGANINAHDNMGYTPLFYAVIADNVDSTMALIEAGANSHHKAWRCQRTILHIAAMYGCENVMEKLIRFDQKKPIPIDEKDSMGLTPMALAAYYRHSTITERLLSRGADPFVKDKYRIPTALRIANTMPTLIRDVFDRVVTEDLYQVYRVVLNYISLNRRYLYFTFVKRLVTMTDLYEQAIVHPKGWLRIQDINKKTGANQLSFYNDLSNTPALIFDFVLDISLGLYLTLKILIFFWPELDKIESVTGACIVMCLWVSGFMKLVILRSVGPFVIFMHFAQQDLKKVLLMFVTLFVPAFLVFYKTIYIYSSDHLNSYTEEEEEGMIGRERRAAKSKGSGQSTEVDSFEGISIVETFFRVLRMVLGDYDYEEGMARSNHLLIKPAWWMIISAIWITVSSIIVLNLLIALMADSYGRIFETAELIARIEQAKYICDLEKGLPSNILASLTEELKANQPIKQTFDPVCDRDKISVIEERIRLLSVRLSKMEVLLEKTVLSVIKEKLAYIEESLTLYNNKMQ
eukprot:sb/3463721/